MFCRLFERAPGYLDRYGFKHFYGGSDGGAADRREGLFVAASELYTHLMSRRADGVTQGAAAAGSLASIVNSGLFGGPSNGSVRGTASGNLVNGGDAGTANGAAVEELTLTDRCKNLLKTFWRTQTVDRVRRSLSLSLSSDHLVTRFISDQMHMISNSL